MSIGHTHYNGLHQAALNERAAAERLGLKAATLRAWRQRGQGPSFVRLGRAIRYLPEDLDRFLQRNRKDSIHVEAARRRDSSVGASWSWATHVTVAGA